MRDLTQGSITRHLVGMAFVIAIGMLVQTLYYLVDLYFVAGLGPRAIAGVSAAGTVTFVVFALTQVLGVGTLALISHAAGRKDHAAANLVFNESLVLSGICGVAMLIGGYLLTGWYMRSIGADAGTTAAGITYLRWYLPGLALQFAMLSMSSALRGTGIVRPTMTVQVLSVGVNIVLAPILIAGWGTGRPLGVAGAGLASSIAVLAGVVLLATYFKRLEKFVSFDWHAWRPDLPCWRQMLKIGIPAGGEFAFMFLSMAVIYWAIRGFGSQTQAGFGIASRLMQSIFLPAMAVAFATAPVAGQNYGARRAERVRETFRSAAIIGAVVMAAVTALCQWAPALLMRGFTHDPQVISVGADYLRIVSWNCVPTGLIFTCSGMFQAIGNTVPALISMASRVLIVVLPTIWLSMHAGFRVEQLWYLSVAAIALQAVLSYALLQTQLKRRLVFAPQAASTAP